MSTTSQKRALHRYSKRISDEGMARFEILVRQSDRELIRSVAKRLASDDPDSARLRSTLRVAMSEGESTKGGILAALRRSPLVGADVGMKRAPTPGRKVEL